MIINTLVGLFKWTDMGERERATECTVYTHYSYIHFENRRPGAHRPLSIHSKDFLFGFFFKSKSGIAVIYILYGLTNDKDKLELEMECGGPLLTSAQML